jgi:CRP-like cAMP-binding protein
MKKPVANAARTNKTRSLVEANSLSTNELFRDLPASCLRTLEKGSEVQEFVAGQVLFRAGETGKALFVVESGRVETFRTSDGKKLILGELEPPDVFGEMGCIGSCLLHCSAQTMERARVRSISRTTMEGLLDKNPSVTRKLLDLVSKRFVHVLLDLVSTSFRQLIPRIANLLLQRAQGDCVENLTHREIAGHLRVYRESATVALGELKKAGIISVDRKQIRIIQRSRLERAARE